MKIIAVDDERRALRTLESAIKSAEPSAEVTTFLSPEDTLKYTKEMNVDVAFLDIKMAEINGVILAKKMKDIYADINIIFVTGYGEYAHDAFELHASGYVRKPIDPDRVKMELENLRNPIKKQGEGIRVQCFGNFDIFVDGEPVRFGRAKAKEMLAYLVDRQGTSASNKEIAAVLWEEGEYSRTKQKMLDTIIVELLRSLSAVGAKHMIIKGHGQYAVDPDTFSCDFYEYENNEIAAINQYRGKYMENYSWAEFTAGHLLKKD